MMTNRNTDAGKIRTLQKELLYLRAEHDKSDFMRFVAWMAFCSDEPTLTLQQLAKRKHASLPEHARGWIQRAAVELLDQINATSR